MTKPKYGYLKIEKMYSTRSHNTILPLYQVLKSYDGHTWVNQNDQFATEAHAIEYIERYLTAGERK